ncbi:uncharacterized protein LOC109199738 [Oreochromis niloticus]|uniref:uncharacterized protein LOC109199738 n=1 Tax=Oreochromis niloticus TaxID=8128 RepID=UPI000905AD3F|nr:uncharacterized protein LOC109199738 [Oreochromis niloticus]
MVPPPMLKLATVSHKPSDFGRVDNYRRSDHFNNWRHSDRIHNNTPVSRPLQQLASLLPVCISIDSEISLFDSSLLDNLDQIDISDLDNYVFSSSPNSSPSSSPPPVLERVTGKNIRLSTRERQALLSARARPASAPQRPSGKNLHLTAREREQLFAAHAPSAPVGASAPQRPSGKNLHLTAWEREQLFAAHAPSAPAGASPPASGPRHPQPLPLRSNLGHLRRRRRRTVRPLRIRSTRQTCGQRNQLASIALRAVSLFAELVQLIL